MSPKQKAPTKDDAATGSKRRRKGESTPPPDFFRLFTNLTKDATKFSADTLTRAFVNVARHTQTHKLFYWKILTTQPSNNSINFIRSLSNLAAHKPMGDLMAEILSDKYRYVLNPTSTQKNSMELHSFNGVIYTKEPKPHNADEDALRVVRLVLNELACILGEKIGKHIPVAVPLCFKLGGDNEKTTTGVEEVSPPVLNSTSVVEENEEKDESDDESNDESDDESEFSSSDDEAKPQQPKQTDEEKKDLKDTFDRVNVLLSQLDTTTYLNAVRSEMHRTMQTNSFYKDRQEDFAKPTPAEFYNSMDSDPNLLAFKNGVMKMNSNSIIPKIEFFKKGQVPNDFVCTMQMGCAWNGEENGTIPDDVTDKVKEVESHFFKKLFFKEDTYKVVRLALGSLLFGGNRDKRLFLLLGEEGDNGKSKLVEFLDLIFGDYAGVMGKGHLTENTKGGFTADPNAPCPSLVALRNMRVVFVCESKKGDKLDGEAVKRRTGGDKETMRRLYGESFKAKFLPSIFWISNKAPRHDGSAPMVKRMYPLDGGAQFKKDLEADDPENGIWKAQPTDDLTRWFKTMLPYAAMFLMDCANDFAQAEYKLPPPPESNAAVMMAENADGKDFLFWVTQNYKSTTKNGTNRIEWDVFHELGAMPFRELVNSYNSHVGYDKSITEEDAKDTLMGGGITVGCVKNDTYKVNINQAVKLIKQKLPQVESDARSNVA